VIGRTFGDYRILEKRGEGGMGMFYRALDLRLDRIVGLKTLRAELVDEPEVLERLQAEAKSLARLDHPNIARLLHYLVAEGQHFIVMEFVDGPDLAAKARQEGLLPLQTLATIVHQICAAIGYAHGKNVIHRDIKPSNVLLTADGTAKVTDFGIAKILGVSARTRTGMATGSLPYMAPEQVRGSGVDARTDIYQLGVTLFELTTGRRPFLGETEYEMMTLHLESEPPRPSSINPRLTAALDGVILRSLAKAPEARFQSAAELDSALQAALAATPGTPGAEFHALHPPVQVPDRDQTALPPAREAATVFPPAQPKTRPPATPDAAPDVKTPRKRGAGWWAMGAAALVIIMVLGWWLLQPGMKEAPQLTEPPREGTPAVQKADVLITAQLPPDIHDGQVSLLTLTIIHPDSGARVDTVKALNGSVRERRTIRPGGSIRFALRGYDKGGTAVAEGEITQTAPAGGAIIVDIPLHALGPQVTGKPQREQQVVHDTAKAPAPPGGAVASRTADGSNLLIDVQPFSLRDQVDQLWIDGRKVTGRLPLKTRADPGVRSIRWQIGADRFTDSVTVSATGVAEKALFIEQGRGRINVAASFDDGGFGEIWLDGVNTGQGTPGELRDVPAGPHEITVRREGYDMRGGPQIVRVRASDRARVQLEMIRR